METILTGSKTGRGIYHLIIELPELPITGDRLNLGSGNLKHGVYRLTRNGTRN